MSEATELNPNIPPASPAAPATAYGTRKRKLVGLLLLLMATWPIIGMYYEFYIGDSTAISYLIQLGAAVIVYFWCRYDAAEIRKRIPRPISTAIIVIPIIGFPIYKVRIKRTPMGEAISLTGFWLLLFIGIHYGTAYLFYYVMVTLGL